MAFAHPEGQGKSDRAIADLLGVSPTMVAKYRPKVRDCKRWTVETPCRARRPQDQGRPRSARPRRPTAKPSGEAGGEGGQQDAAPKADHGAGQHAEVAADIAKAGWSTVCARTEDPIDVYGRMLENLPDVARQQAREAGRKHRWQGDGTEGCRGGPGDASRSLKVFHDAETKLAGAKEST